MMELLVTVAIISVLSIVGFLSLGQYRSSKNLSLTLDEIAATLRATQKRSITQENGSIWGVRFTNTTSSNLDRYEVFQGASFATSGVDQTFRIGRGLQLSAPSPSSTADILFQAISGKVGEGKIISLITGRGDNFVGDVIITTLGRVTTRLEENLVGYWHLDETTSTVSDASGNSRTGTPSGNLTYYQSGKMGKAISFNGTNGDINVADPSLSSTGDLTMVAWAKPADANQLGGILTYRQSGAPYHQIDMFIAGGAFNPPAGKKFGALWYPGYSAKATTNNIADGNWHHFAAVFDYGVGITLYVDGAAVSQSYEGGYNSWSPLTSSRPLKIGSMNTTWYMNGLIDEVRLYNRTLSPGEIRQIYDDSK